MSWGLNGRTGHRFNQDDQIKNYAVRNVISTVKGKRLLRPRIGLGYRAFIGQDLGELINVINRDTRVSFNGVYGVEGASVSVTVVGGRIIVRIQD